MNIFEKMQLAKELILKANLKKSGRNAFANYTYYELADLLPTIIQICNKVKLFTKVSFNDEYAVLEIINIEKPDETIEYTSPMKELNLKGANAVQALGGVETYQRRYLYMAAFDIIENDMFDGAVNPEDNKELPKTPQKATKETLAKMNELIGKSAAVAKKDTTAMKNAVLKSVGVKAESDMTEVQAKGIIERIEKQLNK